MTQTLKTPALLLPLLALAVAPACTGLETGNGHAPPTLVAALSAADADPVDAAGKAFTLATALVHVRHITLDLPDGATCAGLPGLVDGSGGDDSAPYTNVCASGGGTIRLNGPWTVDLLTGQASPAFTRVTVPPGAYRRVDVRLDEADRDDDDDASTIPAALDGFTLAASGTAALAAGPTPFRLALKFSEDARFEAAAGLTLAEDDAASLLLELDPSAWFAGLPLSDCAEDGDLVFESGVLVLEDGEGLCSELENTIKDALKASGELRWDP